MKDGEPPGLAKINNTSHLWAVRPNTTISQYVYTFLPEIFSHLFDFKLNMPTTCCDQVNMYHHVCQCENENSNNYCNNLTKNIKRCPHDYKDCYCKVTEGGNTCVWLPFLRAEQKLNTTNGTLLNKPRCSSIGYDSAQVCDKAPQSCIRVQKTVVPFGTSFNLSCQIEAHTDIMGQVVYEWQRDNETLKYKTGRILQIDDFNLTDVGSYSCRVSHNGTFSHPPVRLETNIPPPVLTVMGKVCVENGTIFVKSEDRVQLKCSSQYGEEFLWWYRANESSSENVCKSPSLEQNQANGNADEALCKSHSLNESQYKTVLLNDLYSNKEGLYRCQVRVGSISSKPSNGLAIIRVGNTTTNVSEAEIENYKASLIKNLTVDKKQLSSTIRKRTSAPDPRMSSATAGVVAILFLTLVFGGIFVSDAITFVKFLLRRHRQCRRKRQVKAEDQQMQQEEQPQKTVSP
ncbi:uncharacterized protein LOC101863138 [Aplysia californica]|uniref:Uncharacterized protein LOC101863138 n=1 Tax=Aplysia californica TaxID=6500 RepID=A0ABM0K5W2_APLCA|nr:uncharacterized protein LOC101863138 [Aplysia californica]